MRWLTLILFAAALLLLVSWTVTRERSDSWQQARALITMREIGHRVLLQSGDSSSRVLPITQPSKFEYLLTFQRPFTFHPDSLVTIVRQVIETSDLPHQYLVQVQDCNRQEIVYGFAINQNPDSSAVPCLGRQQEKNCYTILIIFPGTGTNQLQQYMAAGSGLLALAALSLAVRSWLRRKKQLPQMGEGGNVTEPYPQDSLRIGQFLFYPTKQLLCLEQEQTMLTAKECRLLGIFAQAPNEVINRTRLMKEVWEDEGVIVGRSLDMFVSRLRKKLAQDPDVRLVNIHGKGYKLEIVPLVNPEPGV